MWLRYVAANAELSAPSIVETTAVMLYDSAYAANMATGRWKAASNVALVEWVRKLLAEVEESGRTVHWVHVKGHSADGGNDKADERVQWGKEAGPYARLREGGTEGESRYGAATRTALSGDAGGGREEGVWRCRPGDRSVREPGWWPCESCVRGRSV